MIDDKVPLNIEQAKELYSMGARLSIVNGKKFDRYHSHKLTLDKLRQVNGLEGIDDENEKTLELDKTDLYNVLTWFALRENKAKNNQDLLWYLQFFARIRFNINLQQFFNGGPFLDLKSWY